MKLFSLRLTTLKSKLYAIILASLVVRFIGFFLLPSEPTFALAPDEGGYAEIVRLIASEQLIEPYRGLYFISRPLVLPAAALHNIGIEPLSSVRIISSIYGALTLILVAFLIIQCVNKYSTYSELTLKRSNLVTGLFFVFAFLPSHFLWSILGLRESPMEFWVLCSLSAIFLAVNLQEKVTVPIALLLTISVTLLFNTRPQVAWVLTVTILIFLIFSNKRRVAAVLSLLTFMASGVGYASVVLQKHDVFALVAKDASAKDASAKDASAKDASAKDASAKDASAKDASTCKDSNQIIVLQGKEYKCTKIGTRRDLSDLQNPGELIVEETIAIPDRHKGNQVAAASAIQTLSCPVTEESETGKFFCLAWRSPYMAATFLFRPLIGIDTTSTPSLIAAVENIAWLGAFIFIIIIFIKKRRLAFIGPLAPSLIFFVLYCVGAGSYEGNMGTAFRHKSLILWVILLLVASVTVAEKRPKLRNESAQKGV
jgi:hypothetical protein